MTICRLGENGGVSAYGHENGDRLDWNFVRLQSVTGPPGEDALMGITPDYC
jgi:hypothetical protein